jgi:hypothetical protein
MSYLYPFYGDRDMILGRAKTGWLEMPGLGQSPPTIINFKHSLSYDFELMSS